MNLSEVAGYPLGDLTDIVFLPEPGGGERPIGLLCLFMKLWSKLRQPLCRQWEKAHDLAFFWGSGPTTTCEKAGWTHNLLGAFCCAMGTDSATVLLDLKKFYEHVRHQNR